MLALMEIWTRQITPSLRNHGKPKGHWQTKNRGRAAYRMRSRLPDIISHITKEGNMHDANRRRIALVKAKIAELEEWKNRDTHTRKVGISTRERASRALHSGTTQHRARANIKQTGTQTKCAKRGDT